MSETGDEGGRDEPTTEAELRHTALEAELSPKDHQRIKDLVNGEELERIKNRPRRYLVVGAGGKTDAFRRRMMVYDLLDNRRDAVATRLEDFKLTRSEIALWSRVFDILCGRATHIVGVLEDFDGGYVWEFGLCFTFSYRGKVWVLKRKYGDEETEREMFDNAMAASHMSNLKAAGRCFEWSDEPELQDAVDEIP